MLTNKERITRVINRKAAYQAEVKSEKQQTIIAENCLEALLSKMCVNLDIQIQEWSRDKKLLMLILNHPKAYTQTQKMHYAKYDAVYKTIKALNIKISPKYRWFTSITLHLKQK